MRTEDKTSPELLAGRTHDYTASLLIAFLVTLGSCLYTSYHIGRIDGIQSAGGFITEFPYAVSTLHIWISAALIVCTIALWSRRVVGLVVSFLALLSVCLIYVLWYLRTLKYLRELGANASVYYSIYEAVGFFHGGTGFDFAVLIIVVCLTVWHIIKFYKMRAGKVPVIS